MCSGGTTGVSCILKSMVDVTPQSCLWGNGPLQTSRFQCGGNLSDVGPYFHFRSGCACLCMFGQCSTYCWRRTVCVCICLVKAVHAVSGSACLGEAVHAWSCLIVFGCVWLCLVSSGQGCVPLTRSVVCLLD